MSRDLKDGKSEQSRLLAGSEFQRAGAAMTELQISFKSTFFALELIALHVSSAQLLVPLLQIMAQLVSFFLTNVNSSSKTFKKKTIPTTKQHNNQNHLCVRRSDEAQVSAAAAT